MTLHPSIISQSILIIDTYKKWMSKDLVSPELSDNEKAIALYNAPFVVVSHGIEADPIFNYANKTAQNLWEVSWEDFIQMPSKKSVEDSLREERERLLKSLNEIGYSHDYKGIRISSTGKRFEIINTCVWNMYDENGDYKGQAASFAEWKFIE